MIKMQQGIQCTLVATITAFTICLCFMMAEIIFASTFVHDTGCINKTSFGQNCPWQILLLIMRNPLSFFMTNVGDSFCNSYIYHLVGLHISDIGKEISSLVTC